MTKHLKQLIPVGLALLLLAYTLRGMPLASLLGQLQQAAPGWIALTTLVMGVQTVLRAVRWQMLLRGLGHTPTTGRALVAMLAGSASSVIIPGSGELLRCTLLQRSDNVPITESVGSIVTERLVDLLATAVFLTFTLLLEWGRLLTYLRSYWLAPAWLQSLSVAQWAGMMGAVLFLLALLWLGFQRLLARGVFAQGTFARLNQRFRLRDRLAGFGRGLLSIRRVERPALYWLVTALIHGLSLVVLVALFRALPSTEKLPNGAALTIFALTSLGSLTIPTQANIGSYHFLASRGLVAYGVPILTGTIWATFSHAVITLANLAFSVLGFVAAVRFLQPKHPQNQST
jgi:glycosyltransferase 2 family protein